MVVSGVAFMVLAGQCAPAAAPETLLAIARVESGLDPWAIGVNGAKPQRLHPATRAGAIAAAKRMIGRGANLDLGLGQINVRNLKPLGLTVADAFDPCRNLAAAAQLLAADYALSRPRPGTEQLALRTSLSLYNTGDVRRGFENGYVTKVTAAAGQVVPAIDAGAATAAFSAPSPPAWDVFARVAPAAGAFVFSPDASGDAP